MNGHQFDAMTRDLLASLRDQLGDAPSPTVHRTLLRDVEAVVVERDQFRRLLIAVGRNLRVFGPEGEGTVEAIPDAAAEARAAWDTLAEQLEQAEAERDERLTLAESSHLARRCDDVVAELERVRQIRDDMQRELNGQQADIDSLRRGNVAYAAENGDLRRRHDELFAAHNATVAHRRAVQRANADLRDEVTQLRAAGRAEAHRRHDLVFNGISRALGEQQVFVPLSVRERCAEAALAALDGTPGRRAPEPGEDADRLHQRIAAVAQREYDNSVTTDGKVAHSEFLGSRIAAELIKRFGLLRMEQAAAMVLAARENGRADDPDEFAAGYAAAVTMLRDGDRYRAWWSPSRSYPSGAVRQQLADYLEAAGPQGADVQTAHDEINWSHEIELAADGTWAIWHHDGCPARQFGVCLVWERAANWVDGGAFTAVRGHRYRCGVDDAERFMLGPRVES
ncbi:hypothetical protein [Verrucosispora sp. TAA-831]|uniref:hypothetical protein n=1 Tax=Verrucosispora sp. TAA-831 TaxID=3422227 RepID=UPI003D6FBD6F